MDPSRLSYTPRPPPPARPAPSPTPSPRSLRFLASSAQSSPPHNPSNQYLPVFLRTQRLITHVCLRGQEDAVQRCYRRNPRVGKHRAAHTAHRDSPTRARPQKRNSLLFVFGQFVGHWPIFMAWSRNGKWTFTVGAVPKDDSNDSKQLEHTSAEVVLQCSLWCCTLVFKYCYCKCMAVVQSSSAASPLEPRTPLTDGKLRSWRARISPGEY